MRSPDKRHAGTRYQCQRIVAADFFAHADAPGANDAEVVVPVIERVVGMDRQVSTVVV